MIDMESSIRRALPSLGLFKLRPANDDLLLSFSSLQDFLKVVRACSGANILLEVGWLFEVGRGSALQVESCYLRLELSNGSKDERLLNAVNELLND